MRLHIAAAYDWAVPAATNLMCRFQVPWNCKDAALTYVYSAWRRMSLFPRIESFYATVWNQIERWYVVHLGCSRELTSHEILHD